MDWRIRVPHSWNVITEYIYYGDGNMVDYVRLKSSFSVIIPSHTQLGIITLLTIVQQCSYP